MKGSYSTSTLILFLVLSWVRGQDPGPAPLLPTFQPLPGSPPPYVFPSFPSFPPGAGNVPPRHLVPFFQANGNPFVVGFGNPNQHPPFQTSFQVPPSGVPRPAVLRVPLQSLSGAPLPAKVSPEGNQGTIVTNQSPLPGGFRFPETPTTPSSSRVPPGALSPAAVGDEPHRNEGNSEAADNPAGTDDDISRAVPSARSHSGSFSVPSAGVVLHTPAPSVEESPRDTQTEPSHTVFTTEAPLSSSSTTITTIKPVPTTTTNMKEPTTEPTTTPTTSTTTTQPPTTSPTSTTTTTERTTRTTTTKEPTTTTTTTTEVTTTMSTTTTTPPTTAEDTTQVSVTQLNNEAAGKRGAVSQFTSGGAAASPGPRGTLASRLESFKPRESHSEGNARSQQPDDEAPPQNRQSLTLAEILEARQTTAAREASRRRGPEHETVVGRADVEESKDHFRQPQRFGSHDIPSIPPATQVPSRTRFSDLRSQKPRQRGDGNVHGNFIPKGHPLVPLTDQNNDDNQNTDQENFDQKNVQPSIVPSPSTKAPASSVLPSSSVDSALPSPSRRPQRKGRPKPLSPTQVLLERLRKLREKRLKSTTVGPRRSSQENRAPVRQASVGLNNTRRGFPSRNFNRRRLEQRRASLEIQNRLRNRIYTTRAPVLRTTRAPQISVTASADNTSPLYTTRPSLRYIAGLTTKRPLTFRERINEFRRKNRFVPKHRRRTTVRPTTTTQTTVTTTRPPTTTQEYDYDYVTEYAPATPSSATESTNLSKVEQIRERIAAMLSSRGLAGTTTTEEVISILEEVTARPLFTDTTDSSIRSPENFGITSEPVISIHAADEDDGSTDIPLDDVLSTIIQSMSTSELPPTTVVYTSPEDTSPSTLDDQERVSYSIATTQLSTSLEPFSALSLSTTVSSGDIPSSTTPRVITDSEDTSNFDIRTAIPRTTTEVISFQPDDFGTSTAESLVATTQAPEKNEPKDLRIQGLISKLLAQGVITQTRPEDTLTVPDGETTTSESEQQTVVTTTEEQATTTLGTTTLGTETMTEAPVSVATTGETTVSFSDTTPSSAAGSTFGFVGGDPTASPTTDEGVVDNEELMTTIGTSTFSILPTTQDTPVTSNLPTHVRIPLLSKRPTTSRSTTVKTPVITTFPFSNNPLISSVKMMDTTTRFSQGTTEPMTEAPTTIRPSQDEESTLLDYNYFEIPSSVPVTESSTLPEIQAVDENEVDVFDSMDNFQMLLRSFDRTSIRPEFAALNHVFGFTLTPTTEEVDPLEINAEKAETPQDFFYEDLEPAATEGIFFSTSLQTPSVLDGQGGLSAETTTSVEGIVTAEEDLVPTVLNQGVTLLTVSEPSSKLQNITESPKTDQNSSLMTKEKESNSENISENVTKIAENSSDAIHVIQPSGDTNSSSSANTEVEVKQSLINPSVETTTPTPPTGKALLKATSTQTPTTLPPDDEVPTSVRNRPSRFSAKQEQSSHAPSIAGTLRSSLRKGRERNTDSPSEGPSESSTDLPKTILREKLLRLRLLRAQEADSEKPTSRPDLPQQTSRSDVPQWASRPDLPRRASRPDLLQRTSRPGLLQRTSRPNPPQRESRPDPPQRKSRPDPPQRKSRPDLPERTSRPDPPQRASRPDVPERRNNRLPPHLVRVTSERPATATSSGRLSLSELLSQRNSQSETTKAPTTDSNEVRPSSGTAFPRPPPRQENTRQSFSQGSSGSTSSSITQTTTEGDESSTSPSISNSQEKGSNNAAFLRFLALNSQRLKSLANKKRGETLNTEDVTATTPVDIFTTTTSEDTTEVIPTTTRRSQGFWIGGRVQLKRPTGRKNTPPISEVIPQGRATNPVIPDSLKSSQAIEGTRQSSFLRPVPSPRPFSTASNAQTIRRVSTTVSSHSEAPQPTRRFPSLPPRFRISPANRSQTPHIFRTRRPRPTSVTRVSSSQSPEGTLSRTRFPLSPKPRPALPDGTVTPQTDEATTHPSFLIPRTTIKPHTKASVFPTNPPRNSVEADGRRTTQFFKAKLKNEGSQLPMNEPDADEATTLATLLNRRKSEEKKFSVQRRPTTFRPPTTPTEVPEMTTQFDDIVFGPSTTLGEVEITTFPQPFEDETSPPVHFDETTESLIDKTLTFQSHRATIPSIDGMTSSDVPLPFTFLDKQENERPSASSAQPFPTSSPQELPGTPPQTEFTPFHQSTTPTSTDLPTTTFDFETIIPPVTPMLERESPEPPRTSPTVEAVGFETSATTISPISFPATSVDIEPETETLNPLRFALDFGSPRPSTFVILPQRSQSKSTTIPRSSAPSVTATRSPNTFPATPTSFPSKRPPVTQRNTQVTTTPRPLTSPVAADLNEAFFAEEDPPCHLCQENQPEVTTVRSLVSEKPIITTPISTVTPKVILVAVPVVNASLFQGSSLLLPNGISDITSAPASEESTISQQEETTTFPPETDTVLPDLPTTAVPTTIVPKRLTQVNSQEKFIDIDSLAPPPPLQHMITKGVTITSEEGIISRGESASPPVPQQLPVQHQQELEQEKLRGPQQITQGTQQSQGHKILPGQKNIQGQQGHQGQHQSFQGEQQRFQAGQQRLQDEQQDLNSRHQNIQGHQNAQGGHLTLKKESQNIPGRIQNGPSQHQSLQAGHLNLKVEQERLQHRQHTSQHQQTTSTEAQQNIQEHKNTGGHRNPSEGQHRLKVEDQNFHVVQGAFHRRHQNLQQENLNAHIFQGDRKEHQNGHQIFQDGKQTFQDGQQIFQDGQNFFQDGQHRIQGGQQSTRSGEQNIRGGQHSIQGSQLSIQGGQHNIQDGQNNIQGGQQIFQNAQQNFQGSQHTRQSSEQTVKGDGQHSIQGPRKIFQNGQQLFHGNQHSTQSSQHNIKDGPHSIQGGQQIFPSSQHSTQSAEQKIKDGQNIIQGGQQIFQSNQHIIQNSQQNIKSGENIIRAGQNSIQSGQHSIQGGQHSTQGGQHSIQSGHHNIEDGQHSIQGGQHSLQGGQHSTQGGQHSLQGDQHSTKGGQHSTQSGQHSTRGGQHSTQGGQHSTQGGQHNTRGGQHSTQGGQHSTRGGQHSTQGGQHNTQGDKHSTRGGQHSTQGGQHNTQGGQHSTQGGQHNTRGGQQSTRGGQHNTQGGKHSTRGGQHSTQGGQHNTRGGQHSTQGGQHNTRGGQQSTRGGQHSTQGGQHSTRGGQHSTQGGQHSIQGGQHSTQGGQHIIQGGHHSIKDGQHNTRGGQHSTQGGQHSTRGGQQNTQGGQHSTQGGQQSIQGGQHSIQGGQQSIQGGQHSTQSRQQSTQGGQQSTQGVQSISGGEEQNHPTVSQHFILGQQKLQDREQRLKSGQQNHQRGQQDQQRGQPDQERGQQNHQRGQQDQERGQQNHQRGQQDQQGGQQHRQRGQQDQQRGQQNHQRGQQDQQRGQQNRQRGPESHQRGQQSLQRGQQSLQRGQQNHQRGKPNPFDKQQLPGTQQSLPGRRPTSSRHPTGSGANEGHFVNPGDFSADVTGRDPPSFSTLTTSQGLNNAPVEDDADGDKIPGTAGVDYPILEAIPQTSFTCTNRLSKNGRMFADPDTSCQVYHVCSGHQKFSFLCPRGTIFHQDTFVCQWWFTVDCQQQARKLAQLRALGDS